MEVTYSPKQKAKDFNEEFLEDCKVDQITVLEKLEDLPIILNRWLKHYYDSRFLLNDLKKEKDNIYADCLVELETSDDVRYRGLSKSAMNAVINNSSKMKKIENLIKEQELLVEYLKDVVDSCKFTIMGSCKGIIEIRTLEEM